MLSFDRAAMVAGYFRARAEIRRASVATLAALVAAAFLAARAGDGASWTTHLWILALALAGPWLLRAVPMRGNLTILRIELISFPLNALLLGFIAFMEASRLPKIELEGVPALAWLFPALSVLVPLGYVFLGFSDWLRRLRLLDWIRETLAVPPVDGYREEPEALLGAALSRDPGRGDAWSRFRTVPASARNFKLFLKLDTARHGVYRVAFSDEYALVVFEDGSGCEAVAPGGIHLAVDAAPRPGERERLILVRWNAHFHEGRIFPDDLLKIQAWNSRSIGFKPKSLVPEPFA